MNVKMFFKQNASTILTGLGGVGVVATLVMAVKTTPKAMKLLEVAEEDKGEKLTKLEVIKVAGPTYIPTIIMGAATLSCIFGANVLSKRQQAALTSAYALLDSAHKDYKKKVTELYGEDADERVRSEIAKDKYEEDDIEEEDDGKQLFYDEYSQRYFRATNETIMKAEYELNKLLSLNCYTTLNKWYDLLGIEKVDYGETVGWSGAKMFDMYRSAWIEFEHEKVIFDDGLECFIIHMPLPPITGFEDY